MIYIVAILLVICLICFPTFRCAFFHPLLLVFYGVKDLYQYIKHKEYNNCGTGELVAYTGLFGKGKTLSAVHHMTTLYHKYDGKTVWCRRRKKFVTQRVKVISNVALSIPYEEFVSLEQIVVDGERKQKYDDENDTLTITIALADEMSVQMNSRSFKTNIDPLFLNTLLTCRHLFISMYYTAQRFGHVDALLRQVTSYILDCDKLWRFQRLNQYDAWDMENATNVQLVTPMARSCWFVRNRDYEAYNTLACVGNLKKSMQKGDMMSEEEILKLQMNTQQPNMDAVAKPSKRWIKSRKQQHK